MTKDEALEKKAENAKELGLNYEPEPVAWLTEKRYAQLHTAQRTWVGLTKKEFQEAVKGLEDLEDCWVAIEDKLKEKNT
jgi:hypothetical protein